MNTITPTDRIEHHCKRNGYLMPVREFQFAAPVRAWAFDLAWPALRIAVEIEGGSFGGRSCDKCGQRAGGRHNRGTTFREDLCKYAEATIRGWRVMRVMPEQVSSRLVMAWLDRILVKEKK